MVSDHVTELIPAYVLDCLDESETDLVALHLASCSDCQAELRAYQAIADQLPLSVAVVEPPPQVKANLMQRVQADLPVHHPVKPAPVQPSVMERFMSVFRRFAPALSLASLTLVLLLAFSNLALWRQMQALDNRPLPKTFHLVNLAGTDVSPGASGVLVITGDGEYGTLVVDNLQHLSLEQQYQLWLIRDGKRTSGGVFSVSGEGYAALEISAPMPLATYQSFGITVEPYGGSPGPTGERVLGGSLSY